MTTEELSLPSKGLVYPISNPLSSGKIEMKRMGAQGEDILTNKSYIENGTVLDKLLQHLIVTKINYDDLINGDKNAIMVAARILGYGKDYTFNFGGKSYTIDLSLIDNKLFDESLLIDQNKNEFKFQTPETKTVLTYKIPTHGDEKKIQAELEGWKKIDPNFVPELSTRMKSMILSVNGKSDKKTINEFVDDPDQFPATDARSFRAHIKNTQPDVDLTFIEGDGKINVPIGLKFFWPEL